MSDKIKSTKEHKKIDDMTRKEKDKLLKKVVKLTIAKMVNNEFKNRED
jgi:hypothetical protein